MQSGFPCLSALFVLVISLHSLDCVVALDIGSKRSGPQMAGDWRLCSQSSRYPEHWPGSDWLAPDAWAQMPEYIPAPWPQMSPEGFWPNYNQSAPKHMPVQKSTPPLPQPLPPTLSPSLLWLNKGKVLKWWLSFADRVIAASQQETRNNLVEAFEDISDHEKKSKWRPIIEKICRNHLSRSTLVPSRIAKSESSHPTMSSGKINVSLLKIFDGCAVVHHI